MKRRRKMNDFKVLVPFGLCALAAAVLLSCGAPEETTAAETTTAIEVTTVPETTTFSGFIVRSWYNGSLEDVREYRNAEPAEVVASTIAEWSSCLHTGTDEGDANGKYAIDLFFEDYPVEEAAEPYYEDGWTYINEPCQYNSTYMGVHCITDESSPQWAWLQSHDYGYDADGIATYDGRILVALTPSFGYIGDYVDLLLEDGSILGVIIADYKADADTWGHWIGGSLNVIELLVSEEWYETEHTNVYIAGVVAYR